VVFAERVVPVGRMVDHLGHGFSAGQTTSNPSSRRS
jgi:hypothetical protein